MTRRRDRWSPLPWTTPSYFVFWFFLLLPLIQVLIQVRVFMSSLTNVTFVETSCISAVLCQKGTQG
ncbi:hypothetical protein HanXRQr2_Chr14g0641031 [Helianthus annuus]|uniref:Uncharacterized protein n=1 Tax=Helianthus annuus TaxID=4232 RepID=A0A251SH45_HELAN|nr:hypothetical protein HanXRQr2_Chr14g0641031 [Helianthus annuus]KAJ0468334.1 hypothetical protein HanIR_Chr14g0695451 [Helianthus annuus]KAJ0840081.1 hypothetical protein HanPSC8_Chr14g0614471 [Helianthus annuus]